MEILPTSKSLIFFKMRHYQNLLNQNYINRTAISVALFDGSYRIKPNTDCNKVHNGEWKVRDTIPCWYRDTETILLCGKKLKGSSANFGKNIFAVKSNHRILKFNVVKPIKI